MVKFFFTELCSGILSTESFIRNQGKLCFSSERLARTWLIHVRRLWLWEKMFQMICWPMPFDCQVWCDVNSMKFNPKNRWRKNYNDHSWSLEYFFCNGNMNRSKVLEHINTTAVPNKNQINAIYCMYFSLRDMDCEAFSTLSILFLSLMLYSTDYWKIDHLRH